MYSIKGGSTPDSTVHTQGAIHALYDSIHMYNETYYIISVSYTHLTLPTILRV